MRLREYLCPDLNKLTQRNPKGEKQWNKKGKDGVGEYIQKENYIENVQEIIREVQMKIIPVRITFYTPAPMGKIKDG